MLVFVRDSERLGYTVTVEFSFGLGLLVMVTLELLLPSLTLSTG